MPRKKKETTQEITEEKEPAVLIPTVEPPAQADGRMTLMQRLEAVGMAILTATSWHIVSEGDLEKFKIAAKTVAVFDQASLDHANEIRKSARANVKQLETYWDEAVGFGNRLHKSLKRRADTFMDPWKADVLAVVDKKILDYHDEAKRQEQKAKAEAEAAADKLRREQQEELRRMRLEGEFTKAERLETMLEAALSVPAVMEAPPTMEGTHIRRTKKAEVFDFVALVAAVASGKVPIQALEVNQKFLNQQAVAFGETLNYPGVRVVTDESLVSRTS